MWEHTYLPFGIDAVLDSIAANMAIMMIGGSYNWKIWADIDSTGCLSIAWLGKRLQSRALFISNVPRWALVAANCWVFWLYTFSS